MSERGLSDPISRRDLIKAGLAAAAGLTALPALIAACNTAPPTPTGSPIPSDFLRRKLSGQLKLGNNHPDILGDYPNAAEKAGMDAVDAAFEKLTGVRPALNTFDPYAYVASNTITDPVQAYLHSTPDDLLSWSWCCGYRMRYCAQTSLILPIDEVWALVKDNFSPGFAGAVSGDDGRVYGIPVDHYPWAMFYRKSVWAAHGYEVPTTWDQLLALCARMKQDGLTPIAFGDRDGWPAEGTFDMLNLRLNGYQFHLDLLAGKAKWTDERVTAVFQAWRKLIPFYTEGYTGVTWQQACDTLVGGQAGLYYIGLFMTGEVTTVDESILDDIDFFEFPYFGNEFDAERTVEAPTDVWVMPARSANLAADLDNARAYLEFWAQGSTQLLMYNSQPSFIPTASDVDVSKLDRLSAKSVQMVSRAQRMTQFLDRDTHPDFAGAGEIQSFFVYFLRNPGQDLAKFQQSIQSFWDEVPKYPVS